MKTKKNTPVKTEKIKKMRARMYRRIGRHSAELITHPSIQKAIDEAVDLRDINDNLETLIRDALEAQVLVRWAMMED